MAMCSCMPSPTRCLGPWLRPILARCFHPPIRSGRVRIRLSFCAKRLKRVHDAGYSFANMDASLILAAPKIGQHAATIRERVAKLLEVPSDCVGIKAKTPEGLNLDNTAIAHVVALLEKQKNPKNMPKKKKKKRKRPN